MYFLNLFFKSSPPRPLLSHETARGTDDINVHLTEKYNKRRATWDIQNPARIWQSNVMHCLKVSWQSQGSTYPLDGRVNREQWRVWCIEQDDGRVDFVTFLVDLNSILEQLMVWLMCYKHLKSNQLFDSVIKLFGRVDRWNYFWHWESTFRV